MLPMLDLFCMWATNRNMNCLSVTIKLTRIIIDSFIVAFLHFLWSVGILFPKVMNENYLTSLCKKIFLYCEKILV